MDSQWKCYSIQNDTTALVMAQPGLMHFLTEKKEKILIIFIGYFKWDIWVQH